MPIYMLSPARSLCFLAGRCGRCVLLCSHLLCTWGVRWNARATLKLSPLEAPCPNSIFVKICLGLAVRPRPETAVDRPRRSRRRHHRAWWASWSYLLSKRKYTYSYDFLTFIIVCYYIVPWVWYPPTSAIVQSMIQMWYIIFYNYFTHLMSMTINYATNLT